MTRRERLEAVINGDITEELIADCVEELKKLDERCAAVNAKAKEKETYKENKEYEKRICEILRNEPLRIDEVAEIVKWPYTRQRLTAVCTNLVREGKAKSVDVKVKGKGTRKGYIKG